MCGEEKIGSKEGVRLGGAVLFAICHMVDSYHNPLFKYKKALHVEQFFKYKIKVSQTYMF